MPCASSARLTTGAAVSPVWWEVASVGHFLLVPAHVWAWKLSTLAQVLSTEPERAQHGSSSVSGLPSRACCSEQLDACPAPCCCGSQELCSPTVPWHGTCVSAGRLRGCESSDDARRGFMLGVCASLWGAAEGSPASRLLQLFLMTNPCVGSKKANSGL